MSTPDGEGAGRSSASACSIAMNASTCASAAFARVSRRRRRGDRSRTSVGDDGAGFTMSRARCLRRCHAGPSNQAELLEAERAGQAPGARSAAIDAALDGDRAAAAHRVEEGGARPPPRERDQARGEVLAQRRLLGVAPPAALEQRFAGRVEVERRHAIGQVGVHAHVGHPLVDGRAHALLVAEAVAHGVLHRQRRELETPERRPSRRRRRRGSCGRHRKCVGQAMPRASALNSRSSRYGPPPTFPQHAAREARCEVDDVCEIERTLETDAAVDRGHGLRPEAPELRGERGLEPSGTHGAKKRLAVMAGSRSPRGGRATRAFRDTAYLAGSRPQRVRGPLAEARDARYRGMSRAPAGPP